ncbi:MAG: hypothetical protein QNJ49_05740 [Mastigocoleus sp. MO_167.B18]|uniref:hypothetical protein n=1 Tax=Mastigocoleus sp. MO_188.B34 TaxID=3036635 RepID=UPI00260CB047|nr:hypothetical protein [Mastigocoleus sp. MO_188.B34]MDJ0697964.1 hypothetical protein [Mastigocoleus sp. MO_188.B34]MDJ0772920.1 hypothetical protein [Mastigocoleus sp. MO_167.B18]
MRSLIITDTAWENLNAIAQKNNLSRSDLSASNIRQDASNPQLLLTMVKFSLGLPSAYAWTQQVVRSKRVLTRSAYKLLPFLFREAGGRIGETGHRHNNLLIVDICKDWWHSIPEYLFRYYYYCSRM